MQEDKGGKPELIRESQKKRGASVELVDEVIAIFAEHKQGRSLSLLLPGVDFPDVAEQQTTKKKVYNES